MLLDFDLLLRSSLIAFHYSADTVFKGLKAEMLQGAPEDYLRLD